MNILLVILGACGIFCLMAFVFLALTFILSYSREDIHEILTKDWDRWYIKSRGEAVKSTKNKKK